MNFLPVLFIFLEILSLVFYKRFYFFVYSFAAMLEKTAGKVRVIKFDSLGLFFIGYYLFHLLFLFYCVYLMFQPKWEPGCMLLLLATAESYAVKAEIKGLYRQAANGCKYPKLIFKFFISSLTIFILLNLL
ncbi:MAG: hypothetical protein RSE47_00865 [Acidaminococcaceae bacterium]